MQSFYGWTWRCPCGIRWLFSGLRDARVTGDFALIPFTCPDCERSSSLKVPAGTNPGSVKGTKVGPGSEGDDKKR